MGVRRRVAKLLSKIPNAGGKPSDQAAALCWRISGNQLEVLLISSKDTGRWIISKGNIGRRETSYRAAQREAFEESGVSGKIRKKSIGHYSYMKHGEALLRVAVHLLKCGDETDAFPEQGTRDHVWVPPATAASMVEEPQLQQILATIGAETVLASQDRKDGLTRKHRGASAPQETMQVGSLLPT